MRHKRKRLSPGKPVLRGHFRHDGQPKMSFKSETDARIFLHKRYPRSKAHFYPCSEGGTEHWHFAGPRG